MSPGLWDACAIAVCALIAGVSVACGAEFAPEVHAVGRWLAGLPAAAARLARRAAPRDSGRHARYAVILAPDSHPYPDAQPPVWAVRRDGLVHVAERGALTITPAVTGAPGGCTGSTYPQPALDDTTSDLPVVPRFYQETAPIGRISSPPADPRPLAERVHTL